MSAIGSRLARECCDAQYATSLLRPSRGRAQAVGCGGTCRRIGRTVVRRGPLPTAGRSPAWFAWAERADLQTPERVRLEKLVEPVADARFQTLLTHRPLQPSLPRLGSNGERLDGVFDFLSEEIAGQIKQLEALLGLKDEGASKPSPRSRTS
jgi:hypothetical protein